MNADYSGGVGDLATPETFPIRATFGRWMKALSPLFVLLFLVSVFLFTGVALMVLFFLDAGGVVDAGGVLNERGELRSGGFLAAVVVAAVVCCALMVLVKKRQFNERWGQQTLTLSPAGAVISDPYTRVELPWTSVRSIGLVQGMAIFSLRGTPVFPPLAWLLSMLAWAIVHALDREHGLVGAGLLTANPQAPASVKKQVERYLASDPADPQIGQRSMGVPLMRFDEDLDWQNGRIGQWVRANRPDLLASPPIL